jgi:hypothetical protein
VVKILVRANSAYHSYIWPHAGAGAERWIDENILGMLKRDAGDAAFSVVKIELPDVSINLEANSGVSPVSPTPEAPQVAPKRKPGRPKKVTSG